MLSWKRTLSTGSALLASAGLAAASTRGYTFVPHTNPNLLATDVAPLLAAMFGDPDGTQVLLEDAPNAPVFRAYQGLKSKQGDWTRSLYTNAGLFFWPNGSRNPAFDPPYVHDRSRMLERARTGPAGGKHGRQTLVLHVEARNHHGAASLGEAVPEYVYEGVRLWSEAVANGMAAPPGRILLVAPENQHAAAAFGAAAYASSLGVEAVPLGHVLDLVTEPLEGSRNLHLLAAEAGYLYSRETGTPYAGAAHYPYFAGLPAAEVDAVVAAAHEAAEEGRKLAFDPAAWAASLDVVPPAAGGASWFGPVRSRELAFETWGTSTENGLKNAYPQVAAYGGMRTAFRGNSNKGADAPSWRGTAENPSDIMLKRSMASGPGPDDYFPDQEEVRRYHVWMKFDYQYDKGAYATGDWNVQCVDSYYFGSTWSAIQKVVPMIANNQKANFFPMRWFIAEEVTQIPHPPGSKVMRDKSHLSQVYEHGVVSGMLTLATGGRSFVGDEPNPPDVASDTWQKWHARRTGYILAWRLARLRLRPPFLEVKPVSSNDARCLPQGTPPEGKGSATVRFLERPGAPVRVVPEVEDAAAHGDAVRIFPKALYFTAENYTRAVAVYVVTSGKVLEGTQVPVVFRAVSDDKYVDGVADTWTFVTTEPMPTDEPTRAPSQMPSPDPTRFASAQPSDSPSGTPSETPSANPTTVTSDAPSSSPSDAPSLSPSEPPSKARLQCKKSKDCEDQNACLPGKCRQKTCVFVPVKNCCLNKAECDDHNICTQDKCKKNKCKNSKIKKCKCARAGKKCHKKKKCCDDYLACRKKKCVPPLPPTRSLSDAPSDAPSNAPSDVQSSAPSRISSDGPSGSPAEARDSDCLLRVNHHRAKAGLGPMTERTELRSCVDRMSEYDSKPGVRPHASAKKCGGQGSTGQGRGGACSEVVDAFYNERWSCAEMSLFGEPFRTGVEGSLRKCRQACLDDEACLSFDFRPEDAAGESSSCGFYDELSLTKAQVIDGTVWLGRKELTDAKPQAMDTWENVMVDVDGANSFLDGKITGFKWFGSNTNGVHLQVFRRVSADVYELVATVFAASTVVDAENSLSVDPPIPVQRGDFLGFLWDGAPAFGFSEGDGSVVFKYKRNDGGPTEVGQRATLESPLSRRYHVAASFVPDGVIVPGPSRNYCAAKLCQGHCGPVMSAGTTAMAWGVYDNKYTLNWRPGATMPVGGSCPSDIEAVRCWTDPATGTLWAYGVGGEDCHSTCSLAGADPSDLKCDVASPITGGFEEVSNIMSNFENPYNPVDAEGFACTTGRCGNTSNSHIKIHEYNSNCYAPVDTAAYSCSSWRGNANCQGQRFNQLCPCTEGCTVTGDPECKE